MSKQISQIYEFGEFRLVTAERLLLREGKPISLRPKEFEMLLMLVRRSGHVVGKDELMKEIWADSFVEEGNLTRNIWAVRKALGDDNGERRFVETVPKLGYRFVAPVSELAPETGDVLIHRRVRARIVSEEENVPQLLPPVSPKRRHRLLPITVPILILIGLTATVGLIWLSRSKPVKAEPQLKFLTDGRYDDTAAYWIDDGQLYFSRYLRPGRIETWTMNADGTNQHRANTVMKNLLSARFSPNGKEVVFTKEDDAKTVYLAGADGSNEIALPLLAGNMDWSPDSSQFVYQVRSSSESSAIFLYTVKTKQNLSLTDNKSLNADPSFSPDGKQIAFTSNRDGNFEIYIMQTDGSNLRRLTNNPAFDNYPVFSPDGTQIAFQSNRDDEHVEVYLLNVNDDSPPKRITHTNAGAGIIPKCWSPDGTQILLYTSENGKDQIVLGNVDPPPRIVLSDEAADLNWPSLSRDGKRILYEARTADHTLELRLTDLETKRTRTLFKTERDYPTSLHLEPAWSPGDSLIAFSSRVNANSEILTLSPDGSGLKNVTSNPLADTCPTFSPDGNEIVFDRDDHSKAQLYMMDREGGNQRRVTERPGYEQTAAFSPDGAYLAFAGDREGHGLDIFLLNLKNPNDEKVIASRRLHDSLPSFSPDGKRIAFIATSDGNPEIYLTNSDGTGQVRLTHSKAEKSRPQFSQDGKVLIFAANEGNKFAIYEIPVN